MSFTEFYMNSNGSNLNAGTTCSDVGGGPNTAVFTSLGGNWDGTSVFTPTTGLTTSALVSIGDWASIYPTGNTTTPYIAQVTLVGAGANGTLTLSTTAKFGTAPTSNSGSRNCKTGGAFADLGMIAGSVALNTGTVAQSTRINIKAGTYANTNVNRTFALTGTALLLIWWRGYKTTPGDQDGNNVAVAGTDIPAITFSTGQMIVSGSHIIFSSLDINSACVTTPGAVNFSGAQIELYRFRIQNTAANAQGKALSTAGSSFQATSCYFKSTTTATFCVAITAGQAPSFLGCEFTGGIIGALATGTASFFNCVFDSQAGDAIQAATVTNIIGCSFYAPVGNGVNFTAIASSIVANCYFENVNQAAKAAINNTSGTNTDQMKCVANTYFNCTATISGLGDFPAIFDNGTLGSAGFVAPTSQNFALVPSAWGLAYPGLFELTNVYRGYLDNGAAQHPGPQVFGVES